MQSQSEPVRIAIVPFGTVQVFVVTPPSPQAPPDKEIEATPLRLIEGTTARTRIVSSPQPNLRVTL
jgi:hypothetical protein